ncbi:MAG TPA: hypothetical protein VGP47_08550 [Parachlamydiaceae bacterium]|nr:hypothetical protein [Parachlamydiaceae bacterium]
MKSLTLLLLGAILLCSLLFFYYSPPPSNKTPSVVEDHEQGLMKGERQEQVVHWAQNNLPQTGVLQEGGKGFVYLKVDDDYINHLFSMLPLSGYKKPDYFRRPDAPGAHISVFFETERTHTGKIKEIGQTFSFTLIGLASVPPYSHEYVVLKVKSPELEELRERYGATPLLKDHDFHITIAKKKRRHH